MADRVQVWQHLAQAWKPEALSSTCTEIGFGELSDSIDRILEGKIVGRTVLRIS